MEYSHATICHRDSPGSRRCCGGHDGPVAAAATTRIRPNPGKINIDRLSSGGKAWWLGPQGTGAVSSLAASRIAFGSNVDANDPSKDLAAGQAESAIAAAGRLVLVAWNDATGFLVAPSTSRRASLTGVASPPTVRAASPT